MTVIVYTDGGWPRAGPVVLAVRCYGYPPSGPPTDAENTANAAYHAARAAGRVPVA